MSDIFQQLTQVRQKIASAAIQYNRSINDIQLLAVSKTQAASRIREAYQAGQNAFGENQLQEARKKQQALIDLAIEWHFIGSIQSNKTREIAEYFSWVHSVDRLKIAERLNQQRPTHLGPLNICLQVNIDNEPTKSGVSLCELPSLAQAVGALPQLRLRGLMAVPAKRNDTHRQRTAFEQVAKAQEQLALAQPQLPLDTLSMGMSGDMEAAIAAGSTIVRVGSAIFGTRKTL